MPHQLKRLARRAHDGPGTHRQRVRQRLGGHLRRLLDRQRCQRERSDVETVKMLRNSRMDPLFEAAVQATEEAIVNALVAATRMVGINGHRVDAIPPRASPNSCASTAVDVCVGHRRKILFSIVSAGNHVRFFTNAGQFLERVQPFLLRREAEHCLILGLLDGLRSGDQWGAAPPLMGLVENNGEVAAVALMTPPHNLILSWIGDDSTIDAIAQQLHAGGVRFRVSTVPPKLPASLWRSGRNFRDVPFAGSGRSVSTSCVGSRTNREPRDVCGNRTSPLTHC